MMKKLLLILCVLCLLIFSASAEVPFPMPLSAFTGLDAFLAEVSEENPVVSVSYAAHVYSPLPQPDFRTTDPAEIDALCAALTGVTVERGDQPFLTDSYPEITLARADETIFKLKFNFSMLRVDNVNYALSGADPLWALIRSLSEKYADPQAKPQPLP